MRSGVGARLQAAIRPEDLDTCIHCGLCLEVCPTYRELGTEGDSPRGRIMLVRALAEGRVEPTDRVRRHLDLCLGCRACEAACPSEVPYGRILEGTREVLGGSAMSAGPGAFAVQRIVRELVDRPRRFRLFAAVLWMYQRLFKGRLRRWIPEPFRTLEPMVPRLAPPWRRWPYRHQTEVGEGPETVGFFRSCVMDALYPAATQSAVDLLAASGYRVRVPHGQTCCGALHFHAGFPDEARRLARINIEAFERHGGEVVASHAGGCGAMLKEYPHLFRDDPLWRARAERFAGGLRDVSELVDAGQTCAGAGRGRVTYQDSCHLANVQGVREAPRRLLRAVFGERFEELPDANLCCGSAGVYNFSETAMSMQILDRKMLHVRQLLQEGEGPLTVVTGNPGCLMQMRLGVERAGLSGRVEVVALAQAVVPGGGRMADGGPGH